MKYLIPVSCSCGESFAEDVVGTEVPKTVYCPRCGSPIHLVAPLGNVVAMAILSRARIEFENGDWTLTVVLGAMGVECELEFLFMKWSRLDYEILSNRDATDAEDEAFEKQWRDDFRTIAAKFDKVSNLLTGQAFNSFLSQNSRLLQDVRARYPAFNNQKSAKEFFIEELCYKRNKIVHSGKIDFQKSDAEMCLTLAMALYWILVEMDKTRISTLDAQFVAKKK